MNGDLLIRPALTNLQATKRFREGNKKAKSNSTDPQYEEKLIARAGATQVPGKYHKTKSKASTATKLTFESEQNDLLFLSAIVEKESEYLSDDGYLIFSDSEKHEEEKDENDEINDNTGCIIYLFNLFNVNTIQDS